MTPKAAKLTEARSEELSKFRRIFFWSSLIIFLGANAFSQSVPQDLIYQLSWEKDFELIIELNNIPTKGQVKIKDEKSALEKEKSELLKKKEILEKRLEILNNPVFTDKLYDEMLLEGTNDVSSTKESIQKKLDIVNERLDEINSKLRKLNVKK